MPDRHKHAPLRFRPPEADRLWLAEHAERTGLAVNAILAAALAEFRERHSGPTAPAASGPTTRKPRTGPAPPPATFSDGQPQQAPRRVHALTCKCGICKTTKPEEGKQR